MAWLPTNGTKPLDGNYVLSVLNYINELNESLIAEELKCMERRHQDQQLRQLQRVHHQQNQQYQRQQDPSLAERYLEEEQNGACEVSWDSLLCWPHTPAGTLATLPCFDELNGISYDSTQNASRWCLPNGTWDNYSNYSLCHDVRQSTLEQGVEITTMLYFAGYILSLFTLVVAVSIFVYYKELRCLRNSIHTNLMFTYILADLTWILTTVMQVSLQTNIPTCVTFFSLLHYFHLTNFFWMFVEGLYLYLLVVKTFTGDNIKLKLCLVIGWGLPLLVIAIWGIAKSLDQKTGHSGQEAVLLKHCPWMIPHPYDWFYQAPAILVLGINVIFLFMIMWVLITKLWSANNVETQQYRKASKALLVLIPLLGVTYILVLAGPTEGQVANAFSYARAVLLSTQGMFVALFYCFLNTEVQNTVRHHFARWNTTRDLATGRRYYNNWSPRSRTESIRLYCQPSNPYRKRESTVSETTTTTVIGPNSTFLDKSKKAISEDLNE